MDEYIETDLATDTLCSLQMVEWALKETKTNIQMWKWVILGVHSALQSAMVAHLSGTAQLGANTSRNAGEWLENWNKGGDGTSPEPFLASASVLFERVANPKIRIEGTLGDVVSISDDEKISFDRLNKLRDQLTHFKSLTHLIEIQGIPKIVNDTLGIVDRIRNDGWAFRHADDDLRDKLGALFGELLTLTINMISAANNDNNCP